MASASPSPTPTATVAPGNGTFGEPIWSLNDRVNFTGCVLYALISLIVFLAFCLYHDSRRKWTKLGVHNAFFVSSWLFCICTIFDPRLTSLSAP